MEMLMIAIIALVITVTKVKTALAKQEEKEQASEGFSDEANPGDERRDQAAEGERIT